MGRSLMERLQALEQSVGRQPSQGMQAQTAKPALSLADLGFTRVEGPTGSCQVRVLRYDLLTMHGNTRFAEIQRINLQALIRAVRESWDDGDDAQVLRFYDTETTGLGTGSGTIPFLHAVGQIEGDEFAVYQYFLEDYGDEEALLDVMMSTHFTDAARMVSFNGKSFDWPLLKNRLNLYRKPVPALPQVDLLYPSRRLWKTHLESVSLGSVERGVFGLERADDLPGKEAPSRFFAYAEEKDATGLAPVFEHNATDVCSLVVLACVLAETLNRHRSSDFAGERLAIARYYDEWQEYDLARECFIEALECPDADWRSQWLYSLHLKRRQCFDAAFEIWMQMVREYDWTVQPAVELAKHFEHRVKDLGKAREYTELALERTLLSYRTLAGRLDGFVQSTAAVSDNPVAAALHHRLERILNKLERR